MGSAVRWVLGSLLFLSACSGGGDGPAHVGGIVMPGQASGSVPVEFSLVDPQSRLFDVTLELSVDGGVTWTAATVAAGSVVTNLSSSPAGVRHTIEWDSVADLGFRITEQVLLQVQPKVAAAAAADALVIQPKRARVRLDNLSAAADQVEYYMIHFGAVDAATVAIAETHDLVILYPCEPTVTRQVIADIQDGIDANDPRDDVIVLGYINVGEDDRTLVLSDAQMLADPRFVGNGTGPRVDPRGAGAAGQPLTGIDPLGLASSWVGYASFYLDDNSLESFGAGDGKPDRNGVTGACYANAGAPAWFDTLDAMLCSAEGITGIRETLTLTYGAGLGCDGVFLDNIDTCAPNAYTGPGDPDQAEFEWTAPGYAAFIDRLRQTYPRSVIMQNRGLFFYDPGLQHYGFTTRENIDFLKFESYRLDNDPSREFDAFYFADNKYNFAPKIQAEAYRPRGFQVLSLGYAEGPGISHNTLLGTSTTGFATLVQDIIEAQNIAGFRHYLYDRAGSIVNEFVRKQADFTDTTPPAWASTYNDSGILPPTPPGMPTPRVGIQDLVAGVESVIVRWDVALDLNPVRYVLYYDDKQLNFTSKSPLKHAKRVLLQPEIGSAYEQGTGPNVYPYEARISGLRKDRNYYFCIRSIDGARNEDQNTVVMSTRTLKTAINMQIDGDFGDWKGVPRIHKDRKDVKSGPDWRDIKVVNDDQNLYVYFKSDDQFNLDGSPTGTTSHMLIYIDVDDDPFTGYAFETLGSELLVRGDSLIAQSKGTFDAGLLQTIPVNPTTSIKKCELSVPLSVIDAAHGSRAAAIRLIFFNDEAGDLAPDSGHISYRIAR